MKILFKILGLAALVAFAFASCEKEDTGLNATSSGFIE